MPVIKTLVDDVTKKRFTALAAGRGLSESEYLRSILEIVIGHDNALPVSRHDMAGDLVKMTIRLRRPFIDTINHRAKYKGMKKSRYIANLVQSHLLAQPVMTELEISALRESNRELAAIGRNLNQVARALNDAFHETDRVKLAMIKELNDKIEQIRSATLALVAASKQSWSGGANNAD